MVLRISSVFNEYTSIGLKSFKIFGLSMKKKKILMFCDHPLSTSGVGIQARYLINGLLETGQYSFRCFGAAMKHTNYDVIKVSDDFIVKPIDGFGDTDMLRLALATERPDALFLFTDPRFFMYMWEMEDEIHQICPIVYWHVWDNGPFPEYNDVLYQGTDLINCHSHKTYTMLHERFPDKTNFIPHALPPQLFRPLPKSEIKSHKVNILGQDRANDFVGIWVNRNARRKKPGDVIASWSLFLDKLEEKYGHKNAILLLHTDPRDNEGPNLFSIVDLYGIQQNIFFSTNRLEFDDMNILYNISDFCVNVACAEGFGLSTLEAMQVGKPIIAQKTGGLTRQVVDHRDGSENGIALDPDVRTLVGSQLVPYIYEDHVNNENVADAFMRMYELGPKERQRIGKKAREYALSEFNLQSTVDTWHKTLMDTMKNWGDRYDFKRVIEI